MCVCISSFISLTHNDFLHILELRISLPSARTTATALAYHITGCHSKALTPPTDSIPTHIWPPTRTAVGGSRCPQKRLWHPPLSKLSLKNESKLSVMGETSQHLPLADLGFLFFPPPAGKYHAEAHSLLVRERLKMKKKTHCLTLMPLILFSTVLAVVPNSYDEGKGIQSINTGKYKKRIRKGEDKELSSNEHADGNSLRNNFINFVCIHNLY